MKIAVICPIPLLRKYAIVSDYHMALTHLVLESEEYANFYAQRRLRGDYVILDNSLIEMGSAMDMEKVLEAAQRIKPNEVVLPDVFKEGKATLEAIDRCLMSYGKELAKYKTMAVAQGHNYGQWLECHNELITYDEINVIGIPKVTSTFKDVGGRYGLCANLGMNQLNSPDKAYHLLGVWDNPFPEIYGISAYSWVRGVDTVLPVLMGTLGVAFNDIDGLLVPRPQMAVDFHSAFNPFPDIVERNIFKMLRWGNRM